MYAPSTLPSFAIIAASTSVRKQATVVHTQLAGLGTPLDNPIAHAGRAECKHVDCSWCTV